MVIELRPQAARTTRRTETCSATATNNQWTAIQERKVRLTTSLSLEPDSSGVAVCRLQRRCPEALAQVKRLTPLCRAVLLKDLTRLAHPRPSPSRLDWSVWDQTGHGCLSARARRQSGQYYASPESDELSLGDLSQMASISPTAEVLTSIPLCFRPSKGPSPRNRS
jgi:hypothetical protein